MKRHKIWLALLLSLALGCGSEQPAEEEKKQSAITLLNMSTGQQTASIEEETEEKVFTYSKYFLRVDNFTLDEEGNLYIIRCNAVPKQTTQEIRVIDWEEPV